MTIFVYKCVIFYLPDSVVCLVLKLTGYWCNNVYFTVKIPSALNRGRDGPAMSPLPKDQPLLPGDINLPPFWTTRSRS